MNVQTAMQRALKIAIYTIAIAGGFAVAFLSGRSGYTFEKYPILGGTPIAHADTPYGEGSGGTSGSGEGSGEGGEGGGEGEGCGGESGGGSDGEGEGEGGGEGGK